MISARLHCALVGSGTLPRCRKCAERGIARAQIAQEGLERIGSAQRTGHIAEFSVGRADGRCQDVEGAPVRSVAHLSGVFLAKAVEAKDVITKSVADRAAQDVEALLGL